MHKISTRTYNDMVVLFFNPLLIITLLFVFGCGRQVEVNHKNVIKVTSQTYDKVLDQSRKESPIVLCDFYAEWCSPCKQMEPVIEKVAEDQNVVVLKVDIDECRDIMKREKVTVVPTLLIYGKKKSVRSTGYKSYSAVKRLIDSVK